LNYAARFAVGPRAPAGIILIDGGMTQMDDRGIDWPEMEQRLRPPKLAGMPVDEFMRRLRAWNAEWGASEQALSVYLNSFDISEDDRITPRLTLERHMQIARSLWDFKTYTYFERVRCPVLLLPSRPKAAAGREDREYLSMKERGVDRARQTLQRAHVRWMDDTIHDSPLQRPQELAQAILEFARNEHAPSSSRENTQPGNPTAPGNES
jgi:pimeloyl-ACP methyl ester carboxylesterase